MTTPENPTLAELRAVLERLCALMRAKGWPRAAAQVWIDLKRFTLYLQVDGSAYSIDPVPSAFRVRGNRQSQAWAYGAAFPAAVSEAEALIAEMDESAEVSAAAMAPWFEEVRG